MLFASGYWTPISSTCQSRWSWIFSKHPWSACWQSAFHASPTVSRSQKKNCNVHATCHCEFNSAVNVDHCERVFHHFFLWLMFCSAFRLRKRNCRTMIYNDTWHDNTYNTWHMICYAAILQSRELLRHSLSILVLVARVKVEWLQGVYGELERLGTRHRLALRLAKDPRPLPALFGKQVVDAWVEPVREVILRGEI